MSHPLPKVSVMRHDNRAPSDTPELVCARAVADSADAMAALRRLPGAGASRVQLGQAAEAMLRIEVQMSSLGRELAVLFDCADGGAGSSGALRDESGSPTGRPGGCRRHPAGWGRRPTRGPSWAEEKSRCQTPLRWPTPAARTEARGCRRGRFPSRSAAPRPRDLVLAGGRRMADLKMFLK